MRRRNPSAPETAAVARHLRRSELRSPTKSGSQESGRYRFGPDAELRVQGRQVLERLWVPTSGTARLDIDAEIYRITTHEGTTIRQDIDTRDISMRNLWVNLIDTTGGTQIGTNIITNDLVANGSKNFLIPHPNGGEDEEGRALYLMHGSTESPVSGVEYVGDDTLDDDGQATVTLPDYFDALTKPDTRVVMVTGRGFAPDWTDITDGAFTVTGTPGGRFSWRVFAERHGADFPEVGTWEECTGSPYRDERTTTDTVDQEDT